MCSLVWACGPSTADTTRYGRVGLGGTSDHVLYEVAVTRSVDDGEVVLVGVEPLVGHVDGDTALPLLLQGVHDPGELEGRLALLLCQLPVLLDQIGFDVARLHQQTADRG